VTHQAESVSAWTGTRWSHGRWMWLILAFIVLLAAYYVLTRSRSHAASASAARSSAPGALSVVAEPAAKGDISVRLTGLGTVTPLSTVTVRSRVDGQLMDVDLREGQLVRKGDVIAHIDPRPFQVQLAQAEGQAAKDEATLRDAKIDLQRYQNLIGRDAIPQQQLDAQVATVDQLTGALKSDQSQIASAQLNLTYCRITAPITGRVGLRLVDPGNIVHASDQTGLIVITQVEPIAVLFTIPEDSLPMVLQQVRNGRRLDVEAYNRDLNTRLATGSLLTVDNQIDPTTGTIKLKATFTNSDSGLFPNQFVNARLLVDTIREALIVPTAAIQRSPQSTFVYVVTPDHTVAIRTVQVRMTDGDRTAILGGVSPGEPVVTEGVDKLQPGMPVSIRSADADGAKVVGQ
jgi:membrane fusion protein, multidrug efflux system